MTLEFNSANDRIMVIAPHSDDELLGCGGIIQRALSQGIEVKVVIVTNGDGFRWAAIRNFRFPFVSYRGFRKFGELRQQESVAALQELGLDRSSIYFLGYPDRGLQHLWRDYWHPENQYFSRYTRSTANPYQETYKPKREYIGRNLVDDLKELLTNYRPEKVFLSSTYDDHADHWAIYNFFHYALAQLELKGIISKLPDTYQYLVHRGKWPLAKGDKLKPPSFLTQVITDWIYYPLKSQEIEYKFKAVEEYKSQTKVMRSYLMSFIKDNELFLPDTETQLTISERESIEYSEPVRDTKRRRKLPGVDLEKVRVELSDDQLGLEINTREEFTVRCKFRFHFYLLVKGEDLTREITEFTVTPESKLGSSSLQLISEENLTIKEVNLVNKESLIQVLLTSDVNLEDSYLFFNIESYFKNKLIDRTAWQIVKLC